MNQAGRLFNFRVRGDIVSIIGPSENLYTAAKTTLSSRKGWVGDSEKVPVHDTWRHRNMVTLDDPEHAKLGPLEVER